MTRSNTNHLWLIAIILLIIGMATAAHFSHSHTNIPLSEAHFVASKNRSPFHRPDCKWAQKISPENLETYATREEAIAAGHVPCKVCDP